MSPKDVHRSGVTAVLRLIGARSAEGLSRPDVDELFSAHVDYVWRSLHHLGVADADLEDQTQEVFIVAYRRYATWDGQHARGWLYAIARRCASAYRRRSHRRHELTVDEVPERPPPELESSTDLDLDRLDIALQALDEDKRSVFVLFSIEELPMREVARILGCPVQTAYARLYAARRELSRALTEDR
jgi:RNA polymerase sigma-70 factor (ECF subfamily)